MTEEIIPGNTPTVTPEPTEKRKVSHSETGHAKNVANFHDLLSFCEGYGSKFNPSNLAIILTALFTKLTQALAALAAVNDNLPAWINAIDAREIVFAPLRKLITKVFNSFAASGASPQAIDDLRTIARKMQGRRAKPIPKSHSGSPQNITGEEHKYISASQMSMDNLIENMYKLIKFLESQPAYNPNETELQIVALTTLYNQMRTTNDAVVGFYAPLSNARIHRDITLYHPETGLVFLASEVKKYVKSVFGPRSLQYKQISKIVFKGGADLANKLK